MVKIAKFSKNYEKCKYFIKLLKIVKSYKYYKNNGMTYNVLFEQIYLLFVIITLIALCFVQVKVQLKQGYFLEYHTNIAPKVPYKAEEKGLSA
jgi:hypothetical protein